MIVDGKQIRPIWLDEDRITVKVIDQRQLPHRFVVADLTTVDAVIHAIEEMFVRGAPLIGVTGAYGVMIAAKTGATAADNPGFIEQACQRLKAARPTAVNLAWGVDRVLEKVLAAGTPADRIDTARSEAASWTRIWRWRCAGYASTMRSTAEVALRLCRLVSTR